MKRLTALILAVAFCLLLSVGVFAAVPPVTDQSGLLTDQEQSDLNTFLGQIRQTEGYAVNVVTTDSLQGKSAQQFTEDFYDDHIGGDGVLLMVCLHEGCWYISTNGVCANTISDSRINSIGETVIDDVRAGEYYDAFYTFGTLIRDQMASGGSAKGGISGKSILICLVIGLAAGGITVGVMAQKMRSVRSKGSAADYVRAGSMQVTRSHDIFLYNTVTRRAKPKSSSSGSGGGGRSRGGSGGRI